MLRRFCTASALSIARSQRCTTTPICWFAARADAGTGNRIVHNHMNINEEDLKESFVTGSGPGGSCVNKARNAAQLLHVPTGITVKYHGTRSLALNRRRARQILALKIDQQERGVESVLERRAAKRRKQKQRAARRARAKYGDAKQTDASSDAAR